MVDPPAKTLPSRRPQISREYLENRRRRRYVDAVAELLHEFGRDGASVTNIVRLAGTARNSFYEVFGGVENCLAYGLDVAAGELFVTLEVQDGEGEWPAEMLEAIAGFYGAVADQQLLAELLLIHSPASRVEGGRVAARIGTERFAPLLRRGRAAAETRGRPPLPTSTEEYFSQAIVALAARRVRGPEVDGLPGEARSMAALVGGFYLGSVAAERLFGGARGYGAVVPDFP